MIRSVNPDSELGKFVLNGDDYDTFVARDEDIPEDKRDWHKRILKAFMSIRTDRTVAYKVGTYWDSYYVVRIGNQWYYTQDRDHSASRTCPSFHFYKCAAPTVFESMDFGRHGILQRGINIPWTYCSEEMPSKEDTYMISALDKESGEPLRESILAEWKNGSWWTDKPVGDIYAWRKLCESAPYKED